MKQAYLALAFLITVFLLAGNAYGEDEVYYCADNDGNGFHFDKKTGSYERSGIKADKFKIKLDLPNKKIEKANADGTNESYICTQPYHGVASLSCYERFVMFNFNPDNGRYVYGMGFGYVNGDNDTVKVSIGKCDKF